MIKLKDLLMESRTFPSSFLDWFKGSKVVDDLNRPLRVYKGMSFYDWRTGKLITKIQRQGEHPAFNKGEKGVELVGFFSSDPKVASHFAAIYGQNGNAGVFPVYLKLKNPHIIDAKNDFAGRIQFGEEGRPFRDAIRSGNYDGVIIKNTKDEGDIYIPLKKNQIKSAIDLSDLNEDYD